MLKPPMVVDSRDDVSCARPSCDENGVDLTLIREYLKLTPLERLRSLQNAVRTLAKFRRVAQKVPG